MNSQERKSLNIFERSTRVYNNASCKKNEFGYRLTKARKNKKKCSHLSKTTKQETDHHHSKIDLHEIPAIRLNYRSIKSNNLVIASDVQDALKKLQLNKEEAHHRFK